MRIPRRSFVFAGLLAAGLAAAAEAPRPPVLSEIDRTLRDRFYDPKLKGVNWDAAVAKAAADLSRATTPVEQNAIYDRLLATLSDSHTFRVPPGRLPESGWATVGLRIGRDTRGYSVKGVVPGSSAADGGFRIGDKIVAVDGRVYGDEPVNFRDLFFVFEGAPGSKVAVTRGRPREGSLYANQPKNEVTVTLVRRPEEPADALAWKSARVIRKDGKTYGYARLWGLNADAALAIVDMLSNPKEAEGSRGLSGLSGIDGFLLDVRGNSGGYDPNILPTFLRGQWSAADYYVISRDGKRLVPPAYRPLPVALLTNSGTASNAEALALKFRAHAIGPIVGETTAGMASGGASAIKLSDGSMLWFSERAIEGLDGRSYEGRGVEPDVAVADSPPAAAGQEDAIVEAAIRALSARNAP